MTAAEAEEEDLATTMQTSRPVPVPRELQPQHSAPIGAAYLARKSPSSLPWLLVGMLGMAVLGLVAYIVMQ